MSTDRRLGNDLGRIFWEFRREVLWLLVFSLFANLMLLVPTLYMLQVFDRVLLSANEFTLLALTLMMALLIGLMVFAQWLRSQVLLRSGVRLDGYVNARVFDASFKAKLSGVAPDPMQAFTDLTQLRQFVTGQGLLTAFDLPWTLIYLAVLFMMHPILGWAGLVFVGVLALLGWVGQHVIGVQHVQATQALAGSNRFLEAKLRNVQTVIAMGMQAHLRARWLGLHGGQLQSQARAQESAQKVQAMMKFFQYAQQSLILALGALLVLRGEITMGAMIASNALLSNALRPISSLSSTWRQWLDAKASYRRLTQLLKAHPQESARSSPARVTGQVRLENLQATAAGRKQQILKGLTVTFTAGEVVAIVGPSGAGKSTLARCLLGIWPMTSGKVLLDGVPIQNWARDALGPQLGYLPQDVEMFAGTLAQNIARFGQIDSARVIEAAQRTGIHEMILRCPQGYDTPMGEAGSLFSGGQRQRVGLARALYGNPMLVVLDEPNSQMDDAGIAALLRCIVQLRERGASVWMVTHQAQLVAAADRVLVMNEGSIADFALQRGAASVPTLDTRISE